MLALGVGRPGSAAAVDLDIGGAGSVGKAHSTTIGPTLLAYGPYLELVFKAGTWEVAPHLHLQWPWRGGYSEIGGAIRARIGGGRLYWLVGASVGSAGVLFMDRRFAQEEEFPVDGWHVALDNGAAYRLSEAFGVFALIRLGTMLDQPPSVGQVYTGLVSVGLRWSVVR